MTNLYQAIIENVSMQFRYVLLFALLLTLSVTAEAQSNLSFYGQLDAGLRYRSNQNIEGDSLTTIGQGTMGSSRWGITGNENLGDGLASSFKLESGFNPTTGTLGQGGTLFGRQAWIAFSSEYGSLTIGRQNNPLYNSEVAVEPFGAYNVDQPSFIYDNYGGGDNRWSNSVNYAKRVGDFTGVLMLGFGQQAGNAKADRNFGASLAYAAGAFTANTAYQQLRDSDGVIDERIWNIGGTVNLRPVKLFLGYLNHRSGLNDQTNAVIDTGFIYSMTPNVDWVAAYYHDQQRNLSGVRNTVSLMSAYKFSKFTSVYIQADYSKIDQGYLSNMYDTHEFPRTYDAQGNVLAYISNVTGVTIGLRHAF